MRGKDGGVYVFMLSLGTKSLENARSVELFNKFLTMSFTTEVFIQIYNGVFDIFSGYQRFTVKWGEANFYKSKPIRFYLHQRIFYSLLATYEVEISHN